ncbi:hypothetical protein KTD33_01770 [Burkholderia gladioli]|uniref:hypothetical protein n=2 Tax=Burkholderia gladioli TaxID=28095 RepID=UPI000BEF6F65|nr:hypothetical protein [Burkholderia gladioli]MBU9193254.1 hypothetical protein [Burkholderia gladioli]MDN7722556.1 hypothetical protein [Burkholderia gladioli]PEH82219.1 hypothetical protein CRM95_29510 [Burkholderia gladioli]
MRSPWHEVHVMVDGAALRLLSGAAPITIDHEGDPAAALAACLDRLPRRRLAVLNRLHLVLAHPWAHAVVLPWQDGMLAESAWQAYARALLAERAIHDARRVRIEASPHGRSRLAVAAPEALIETAAGACRDAGWTLAGCRDLLSAALHRHAGALAAVDDARLALLQAGALTCVFRRDGQWRDVITLAWRGGRLRDVLDAAALMARQPASTRSFLCAVEPVAASLLDDDERDGGGTIRLAAPLACLDGASA